MRLKSIARRAFGLDAERLVRRQAVAPLRSLLFLCVAVACVAVAAYGQFEAPPEATPVTDAVRFEVSESLFTAMALINAAGYDEDLTSPSNHPARNWVRQQIAAKNPPIVADLKQFYKDHRRDNWQQELSQYVSFGLVTDGPPEFNPLFVWNEMPPDTQELRGFEAYLRLFHAEAKIGELWRVVEPQFEPLLRTYQPQVADTILKANSYLRNPTSGTTRRTFQIVLDVLGAPNHVETRAYDNMAFVVVTPTPEFPIERVKLAYLHYLIDPVVYRYRESFETKRAVMDFALGAPMLSQGYKEDFALLVSACLVRAVAARMEPMPTAQRQARVQDALEEGFVLTPFFYEALVAFEKQPANLRYYFEEMIASLDVYKENARLKDVQFREARQGRLVRERKVVELSDAEKMLEEAEALLYEKKDYPGARQLYRQLSENAQNRSIQSRAYFGLGRLSVLDRQPDLAIEFFQRALEFNPDPATEAWSRIYLGRLADIQEQPEKAVQHFRAALKVPGLTRQAADAARQGLEQAQKRLQ
ncbi:MAG: tetratricopeptide repeat protein [Bryobacterales bacterium]|nr:tetratricopeptide repeat protein [Bryobacterales bacterium]